MIIVLSFGCAGDGRKKTKLCGEKMSSTSILCSLSEFKFLLSMVPFQIIRGAEANFFNIICSRPGQERVVEIRCQSISVNGISEETVIVSTKKKIISRLLCG